MPSAEQEQEVMEVVSGVLEEVVNDSVEGAEGEDSFDVSDDSDVDGGQDEEDTAVTIQEDTASMSFPVHQVDSAEHTQDTLGDGNDESEGQGVVPPLNLPLRPASRADLTAGPQRSARHRDWTVSGVQQQRQGKTSDVDEGEEEGKGEGEQRPPRVPVTGPVFNRRVKNIFARASADLENTLKTTPRGTGGTPFQATSMTEKSPLLFSPRRDLDRDKRKQEEEMKRVDRLNALMHDAAQQQNFGYVYQLTLRGADLSSRNDRGETVIHIASKDPSYQKHLRMLVAQVDVNLQDNNGDTPLHTVIANRNVKALPILLDANADPNIVNKQGLTPVHQAAALGYVAILEALVRVPGCNIELRDPFGNTALHHAARCSRDCVIALTGQGADLYVMNKQGMTPLDVARQVNHGESIATLSNLLQPASTVASRTRKAVKT